MRHLILVIFLMMIAIGTGACHGGLANGNLVGVVIHQSTGNPVVNPVLIIGRVLQSPTVPDQMFSGDAEGRFGITVHGGNYTVQIGTSPDGPFYTWPDSVYVQENHTTVVTFVLPDDY